MKNNIAKPLKMINNYKQLEKVIETYQKLTNKLSNLT